MDGAIITIERMMKMKRVETADRKHGPANSSPNPIQPSIIPNPRKKDANRSLIEVRKYPV